MAQISLCIHTTSRKQAFIINFDPPSPPPPHTHTHTLKPHYFYSKTLQGTHYFFLFLIKIKIVGTR